MYNKNQIYDIGELVRMKVILNDYDRGTFIKIIREWTGLTQKEFAKVLGKCERTIQEYEAGTIALCSPHPTGAEGAMDMLAGGSWVQGARGVAGAVSS